GLVVDEHAPAMTLGKSQPETLLTDSSASRWPQPSNWLLRQGLAAPSSEEQARGDLDLGQYGQGPALAQAVEARGMPVNATPVGFRVLQLKDDS
ncbi:hypothetical protein ABTC89_19290, partial [Acinetobacter baumannii]